MYSPLRFIPRIFRKSSPVQLTFFVTSRCNMKCPFCFAVHGRRPQGEAGAEELSIQEVEKIARSSGPLLWLILGGGEPFLRDDLDDISLAFYRHARPSIVTYVTNGFLPETIQSTMARILRNMRESVVVVKLSLDGLGEDHDHLRGTPGSFERVMKTYDLLSSLAKRHPNLELGFNTVFCRANQYKVRRVMDFVQGLGGDRAHTISVIRGTRPQDWLGKIDLEEYVRVIEHLERVVLRRAAGRHRFRGARIKAAQDILQRRLIHETLRTRRRLLPCYAGKLNLVLGETGEVYACELSRRSLGHVRHWDYNPAEILRSATACEVLREIEGRGCYCSHECTFVTNILFNPRMLPALARTYLGLH